MKSVLICALMFIAAPFAAHADDDSSGCGVGWMVFKEKSLVSSSLRATTNATFLNTIAMTFGTSGCAKHKIVQQDKASQHFAEVNGQQLMQDMARGEGEYLNAFAGTLGCKNVQALGQATQKNFMYLYPHAQVPASQVVEGSKLMVLADESLAKSCAFAAI